MVKKLFVLLCLFFSSTCYAFDNYSNVVAIRLPNINFKTASSSLLMTTENGTRNFYVTGVDFETTASAGITIAATASVGTNSTSYNNVLAATLLSGLTSTGLHFFNNQTLSGPVIAPNTPIYVNFTIGATGTSQTGTVTLIGYYK